MSKVFLRILSILALLAAFVVAGVTIYLTWQSLTLPRSIGPLENYHGADISLTVEQSNVLYVNQTVHAHWDVRNNEAIYFNGRGVVGVDDKPAVINRCSPGVEWQIDFTDGTSENFAIPVNYLLISPLFWLLILLTISLLLLAGFLAPIPFLSKRSREIAALFDLRSGYFKRNGLTLARIALLVSFVLLLIFQYTILPTDCFVTDNDLIQSLTVILYLLACAALMGVFIFSFIRPARIRPRPALWLPVLILLGFALVLAASPLRDAVFQIFRRNPWFVILFVLLGVYVLAVQSINWNRKEIFLNLIPAGVLLIFAVANGIHLYNENSTIQPKPSNALVDLSPAHFDELSEFFSTYNPQSLLIFPEGLTDDERTLLLQLDFSANQAEVRERAFSGELISAEAQPLLRLDAVEVRFNSDTPPYVFITERTLNVPEVIFILRYDGKRYVVPAEFAPESVLRATGLFRRDNN